MKHDDDDSTQTGSRQNLSSGNSDDFSISDQWDALSLHSYSTRESVMSTDASRFRYICNELNAPPDFVEVVGRRLLGLRDKSVENAAAHSGTPNLDKIVDFMADAFIRCTKHANLALLALDDVHWMDEMSWKVVEAIYNRGANVLILCGSRPIDVNPLRLDPKFWSSLQESKVDRYLELFLNPLSEFEVQEMIAITLQLEVDEIDSSFSRNVFTTSGGMPHYLSYVLETIKRDELAMRLENGLMGLKNAASEDTKLGFGSVSELLLYRLDTLDASVRNALHLAAVLGTEFEFIDAALVYEEMFSVQESGRVMATMALRDSFDIAVEEGIIEESLTLGDDDEVDEDVEEALESKDALCASLGNVMISLTGRKAHPSYAENRRYRFTHDSWKTSILNVMLDERIQEIHEQVAITLERELGAEARNQDDFEKQIRIFKHWNSSGHFTNASELALKIGGQLMLLGLNTQSILLFDDVLNTLKDEDVDQHVETYGGISAQVLNAIDVIELENLIKLNVAKGKAFSTLGKAKCGAKAMQSALDVSDLYDVVV
eukprot:scaffold16_cov190-Alexandrium_tamarense.AAC.5